MKEIADHSQQNIRRKNLLHITLHQISFLISGLCTTLGIQWLFYKGAATSMSLLPQLSSYTGMLLIGAFVPFLIRRKKEEMQYKKLPSMTEVTTIDDLQRNSLKEPFLSADVPSPRAGIDTDIEEEVKRLEVMNDEQHVSLYSNYREEAQESTAVVVVEHVEEDIEKEPIPHLKIIKLATLEVISSVTLTVGFSSIGSGMFQVIYSSVVIWCAILTWIFMGKSLAKLQWLAIIGTSIGLGICSFDNFRGIPPPVQEAASNLDSPSLDFDADSNALNGTLWNGTLITFGGTLLSACIYVYSDNLLSSNSGLNNEKQKQTLPAVICCWMGVYTSCYTWLWIFIYTIPRFNDIIHIDATTTSTTGVILVYFIVTVAHTLHSYNYYELIDRTGNVATGILQGLRAILVYAISHASFCQTDSAQCFTVSKGFGSLIVISCVLLFSLGRKS